MTKRIVNLKLYVYVFLLLMWMHHQASKLQFSKYHFSGAVSANWWSLPSQSKVYIKRRQKALSVVLQFPYMYEAQSLRMNNSYSTSNDSGHHYNKWSQQQKRSKSMFLIMWLILILRLMNTVDREQLMLPVSERMLQFLLTAMQLNRRHLSCLMSWYTGYRVVNITCYANGCIN